MNRNDIEPLIGMYDYLEELYEETKDIKIKEDMDKIKKELKETFNIKYPEYEE